MKPKSFLFLILVFLSCVAVPSAIACLNDGSEFRRPLAPEDDGQPDADFYAAKRSFQGHLYPSYLQNQASHQEWEKRLLTLETQLKAPGKISIELKTSYGVALVHLGEYSKALEIFKSLEKEQPGYYPNAANLGTTYELLGDNQSALEWIKEGIRRYPQSHGGTEWLHVKILETKLALKKDPNFLERNSVLGLDWGQGWKPKRPKNLSDEEIERIVLALHHQLRERIEFVKAPDPIVGDLLFDLANLAALESSISHPHGFDLDPAQVKDLYQYSMSYHAPSYPLAEKRFTYYALADQIDGLIPLLISYFLIFLLISAIAILLYRIIVRRLRQQ